MIERSFLALRMYSTSVSEPTTAPFSGSMPLRPELIMPYALMTAMRDRPPRPIDAAPTFV